MNGITISKSDMITTILPNASPEQSESLYVINAEKPDAIIPKWINVNIMQLTIMIFIVVYITNKK